MNERIQKLYEQSFVTDSYVNVGPDGAKLGIRFDPNKFAELIVRECANVVSETRWHLPPTQQQIAISIKEHFGVE